jgi:hypothetical protein
LTDTPDVADQRVRAETENPLPTDEKEFKCFIAEPSSLDSDAASGVAPPYRATVKAEVEDPVSPNEPCDGSRG